MCGVVFVNSSSVDLVGSINSIKHRGPDNQAVVGKYECQFGHARLSIIDLNVRSNQPFSFRDKILIFNGEIFNYKEIREELITAGYAFETESDTEVVIKAFDLWGESCVGRFNGFWTIIISFKNEFGVNTLFVSRDRFGIKPLYYYLKNDLLCFASEVKALREIIGSLELDIDWINNHFTFDNDDNVGTAFKDVHKFPPGSNSIIDLNNISVVARKYWSLEKSDNIVSLPSALEEFSFLLEDSLKLRMRSDVEVALTLSGGIDSSAIALACKKNNFNIKAFTSSFPGHNEIDESNYAKIVSRKCDLDHKFVFPSMENIDSELDQLIKALERPYTSFSQLVNYFVMKAISDEGIKVFLNGQGSDEIFLGYDRYFVSYILAGGIDLRKLFFTLKNSDLSLTSLLSFLFYFGGTSLRSHIYNRRSARIFTGVFTERNAPYKVNLPFDDLKYQEIVGYQLQRLLEFDDKISSNFSLEGRPVFLDHRIVEFGYNLDDQLVINKGWNKYIVRQYLSSNGLPEIAWRRNKLGFPSPNDSWLESAYKRNKSAIEKSHFISSNFRLERRDSFQKFDKNVLLQVYLMSKCFT